MRNIGLRAYDAIFGSEFGKAIFKPLELNPARLLEAGPLAFKVTINFGKLAVERVAERHYRMRFTDMPTYIEHYQVGAVEGAIQHCGYRPAVKICATDLANAVLDVQWFDA
jgi:uncharacterized protein (TIGR02265 family)